MTLAGNLFASGAVAASGGASVCVIQPRSSNIPSRGLAGAATNTQVTSRTSTAGSTATVITDAGTPGWVASDFIGHIIEGTSGANNGIRRVITANGIGSITVDCAFPAAMASMTFRILEPDTAMPIVTDWSFSHTATAAVGTLRIRGLVGSTLTTRDIAYYNPGAATSGTGGGTGMRCPGIAGGDVFFAAAGALAGNITVSGYWANPNQSIA